MFISNNISTVSAQYISHPFKWQNRGCQRFLSQRSSDFRLNNTPTDRNGREWSQWPTEREREIESGSDAIPSLVAEWETSKLQSSETTSVALSSQPASKDFLNYQECRSAFSLFATLKPRLPDYSARRHGLTVSLCF